MDKTSVIINETEEVERVRQGKPLYDFTASDGVIHRVWRIEDQEAVERIQTAFSEVKNIYIADGHHRCASAVKVSRMRREENPNYTGKEEFNHFLSVLFPDDQLMIMDYNRVVKDLNGWETSRESWRRKATSLCSRTKKRLATPWEVC